MITLITGLTGSGKTWLMSRLMLKEWKKGNNIYANFPLFFSPDNDRVGRWHALSEIYHLKNGIIGIDEGQKLFDARLWPFLPISFAEKIAQHRKHFIDIITTSQDIGHIDLRFRSNIHELYNCKSIFRFPKDDRVKPLIQMIRITKKQRNIDEVVGLKWTTISRRIKLISKFWTKELYNTYGDIGLDRFICKIIREKKAWKIKIFSREIANQRRNRL